MFNATEDHEDHPFRCSVCENRYRTARHAAKCHKAACVNVNTGERYEFSEADEASFVVTDAAHWAAVRAEHCFECECGEHYRSVEDALRCRKCVRYLDHSCEVVYDTRLPEGSAPVYLDPIVALREAAIDAHNARLEAEEKEADERALAEDIAWKLARKPFSGLVL